MVSTSRTPQETLKTGCRKGISYVIVAFKNDTKLLQMLVNDLLAGTIKSGRHAECLIVLNDETTFDPPSNVRVITGHGNIGFAAGVTKGVHSAREDKVVIVNPDCSIGETDLCNFLDELDKKSGIMTPLLRNTSGGLDYASFENWVYTPGRKLAAIICAYYIKRSHKETIPYFVKVPGTFVGMDKQTAFKMHAPFDPQFFLYGEDRDLTNRARKLGVPMRVVRRAVVDHIGGESGKTVSTLVERCKTDSALRIASRRYGRMGVLICVADLVLVGAAKDLSRNGKFLRPRAWAIKRWSGTSFNDPGPLTEEILKDMVVRPGSR